MPPALGGPRVPLGCDSPAREGVPVKGGEESRWPLNKLRLGKLSYSQQTSISGCRDTFFPPCLAGQEQTER